MTASCSSGFVTTCMRILFICMCGCTTFYTNVTFVESRTEITIDGLCGMQCNTGPVSLMRGKSDLLRHRYADAVI